MMPLDYMVEQNPEADPERLAEFLARLVERGIYLNPPDDTLPASAVVLSPGDVVRLTNPVVWAPDGKTPVVLVWGEAKLYTLEEP